MVAFRRRNRQGDPRHWWPPSHPGLRAGPGRGRGLDAHGLFPLPWPAVAAAANTPGRGSS